jgi:histidinol phosphatase-like PHP family hydrolase
MDKVIAALKKSGVALEINNRYKIPSASFIKKAKAAGVKFAFGTNNTDSKTGDLDYCREMIAECGLVADDMWHPKK